ncbi:hypothetical protein C8Q74DRAFT_1296425, partial [Fomes fomentarius]
MTQGMVQEVLYPPSQVTSPCQPIPAAAAGVQHEPPSSWPSPGSHKRYRQAGYLVANKS